MGDRSPKDKAKNKKQHDHAKQEEHQKKKEFWNKTHQEAPPMTKQDPQPYKKAG